MDDQQVALEPVRVGYHRHPRRKKRNGVSDVQPVVEKETPEKKAVTAAVEVEDGKTEKKEDSKTKENGRAETNEKEAETNGRTETTEVTAAKRKSGAGDAPDGTPAEGATPEKKAKISNDDKEKDSTNGESEVASEGAAVTPNSRSYQKH